MSFCAYCGTELTRDANFCFHCGKKVVKLPDNNMKDLATDNENLTHQHFDNESLLEIIKERRDKGEFSRLSIVNKNLYLNSKLLGEIGEFRYIRRIHIFCHYRIK